MGLINRVAISNTLNYHGDGKRKKWSPKFRYECLDFRGQSTAMNLTNGGGKTTLAEALLAVLSRDHSLVSRTKKKFSPKSCGVWSHIQVELIRPLANSGQSDFLTEQGNEINGEHWVFGMYGHRGDQGINYYYFKGRLEELPIGTKGTTEQTLTTNEDFTANRKSISSMVPSPLEDEWAEALALKVNLPQSTIRQMTDFQKRGGQDKSALLYDIKQRPGQTYAEAFFHKVLAPAIMEGIMDREGDDGEVSLEDSVERSVFSTVKAKQDTESKRRETEGLKSGVDQLAHVIGLADEVEDKQSEYTRHLSMIQTDVKLIDALVAEKLLPGVPGTSFPPGIVGDIARHLVVEPGSTDILISDQGLAELLGTEVKVLNQRALRNSIEGAESTQVIDFTCDFKVQGPQRGGRRKGKNYKLNHAKSLITASSTALKELTAETAIEFVEDAITWFDTKGDRNPYRGKLIELKEDQTQLHREYQELDECYEQLMGEQLRLQQQQQRMETYEGQYAELVDSGLFTDEELKYPSKTAGKVKAKLHADRSEMRQFEQLEVQLNEYRPAWEKYVAEFGSDESPDSVLSLRQNEQEQLSASRKTMSERLSTLEVDMRYRRNEQLTCEKERYKTLQELERFSEHRDEYASFIEEFGNIRAIGKEEELNTHRIKLREKLNRLQHDRDVLQEDVDAVNKYRQLVPEPQPPQMWLDNTLSRRAAIAIEINSVESVLVDFEAQRSALENESIAPSSTMRNAQHYLESESIPYKPIHHAIFDLKLSPKRKRQVLGVFSAVLFAPVLDNEAYAIKAAKIFEENGVQIPVFLKRSFDSYCNDAEIESTEDGLKIGTTAGIITRSVECLLDPDLVEREKLLLEGKIESQGERLEQLKEELASISDETEIVQIARRAKKAIEDDSSEKLEQVIQSIKEAESQFHGVQKYMSGPLLLLIRAAARYEELGGLERDAVVKSLSFELENKHKELVDIVEKFEDDRRNLIATLESLDEKLLSVLPFELATMLNSACKFYDKKGPEFLKVRDEQYEILSTDMASSEARNAFEKHFNGAQMYIDSIGADNESKSIQAQLAEIGRNIRVTKTERTEKRSQYDEIVEVIPNIQRSMESLDKAVILALKKYKNVASLSDDLLLENEVDISTSSIVKLCKDITHELEENILSTRTKPLTDKLIQQLEEIDIDRKAADLRRVKADLERKVSSLVSESNRLGKSEVGLQPVERQSLLEVKLAEDIPKIRTLYEGVLELYNKSKYMLHQYESAERESRLLVNSRLAHLIEYAALDLSILKSVVGSNRGTHTSYFNIDADVLGKEGIQKLLDNVVAEIDLLEQQRREREQKVDSAKEDESYHDGLRNRIKNKLYKAIFTEPKITYVNTSIRGAGDEHEFNENLSEGQKAALSLMWAIRLAEFAIEREAKRISSRRSQQKAREMSVNIMLIDGLFSNLSNRELIDSSMAGIESTRGSFQLIGLIHNPHYQNDFDKFPVFIIGKNQENGRSGSAKSGWVSFENGNSNPPSFKAAQLRRIPADPD